MHILLERFHQPCEAPARPFVLFLDALCGHLGEICVPWEAVLALNLEIEYFFSRRHGEEHTRPREVAGGDESDTLLAISTPESSMIFLIATATYYLWTETRSFDTS